jgi:dTDP-4-dehydrorhamnose 3,5-epimerase
MELREATLHGVWVVEPRQIPDDRGWFMRVFSADLHARAGIDHTRMVQENQSRSRRGTLRGLHARTDLEEAKLIRCVRGAVYDVLVDLRPWSPTFLQWESYALDDEDHRQVYAPGGLAHGFQALTDDTDVCYRVEAYYAPDRDMAVAWDDPDLAIPWPIAEPVLSDRDRSAPSLQQLRPRFEEWYGATPP